MLQISQWLHQALYDDHQIPRTCLVRPSPTLCRTSWEAWLEHVICVTSICGCLYIQYPNTARTSKERDKIYDRSVTNTLLSLDRAQRTDGSVLKEKSKVSAYT